MRQWHKTNMDQSEIIDTFDTYQPAEKEKHKFPINLVNIRKSPTTLVVDIPSDRPQIRRVHLESIGAHCASENRKVHLWITCRPGHGQHSPTRPEKARLGPTLLCYRVGLGPKF